jgi:hypothetical protein
MKKEGYKKKITFEKKNIRSRPDLSGHGSGFAGLLHRSVF